MQAENTGTDGNKKYFIFYKIIFILAVL